MIDRLTILAHYLRARRRFTHWNSRADLLDWQDRQVRRHLGHLLPKSRFLRGQSRGLPIKAWRDWQVTGKAEVMADFAGWNTHGISLEEAMQVAELAERSRDFAPCLRGVTVGLSSGTSGSRGIFLATAAERLEWAGTLLARVLAGSLGQSHRAALFLRADSNLYRTVGSRRFQFHFFDLLSPLDQQWPALRELGPTLLVAPPSVLAMLAAQPDARNLLTPPSLVLSVADVLDDRDRMRIEAGLACRMGQIYQATEGFLAATCPYGRLHWNEDVVAVQEDWLDAEHTRWCPILTDFRRVSQPIIRYRLDDVIIEPEEFSPCPCGSVFRIIGRIEGRQDEILVLPHVDDARPIQIFPDFIRRAFILALPDDAEFSVVETARSVWTVGLTHREFAPAVEREIGGLCQTLGVAKPVLQFTAWQTPLPGAKRRRIQNLAGSCASS